jgi:hypothetical protein
MSNAVIETILSRTAAFGAAAMIYAARSPGLGSTPMMDFV